MIEINTSKGKEEKKLIPLKSEMFLLLFLSKTKSYLQNGYCMHFKLENDSQMYKANHGAKEIGGE